MDYPKGIKPHGNRLRIRVQKHGKRHIFNLDVGGNPHTQSAIAQALRVKRELESRLNLGLPIVESDEGCVTVLFAEAAQRYLDQCDVEYSTALGYQKIINRYWLPQFGNLLVNEIKPTAVNQAIKGLPVSRKTMRNALGPLRGIFDWAIQCGYTHVNPCTAIRIRKHASPPQDPFTPREKDKILAMIHTLYGPNSQRLVYYTLLFETGMRPSEALALTWVDYDGEFLAVNKAIVCGKAKASTKNHETRRVYVNQRLRSALTNHVTRFAGEHIFVHSRGGPYLNNSRLDEHWRKILTKGKIRYRRPYNCRHSYAAIGLSAGLEPAFLAAQLGHTLEVFYRTYASWIAEDRNAEQYRKLEELARPGRRILDQEP